MHTIPHIFLRSQEKYVPLTHIYCAWVLNVKSKFAHNKCVLENSVVNCGPISKTCSIENLPASQKVKRLLLFFFSNKIVKFSVSENKIHLYFFLFLFFESPIHQKKKINMFWSSDQDIFT